MMFTASSVISLLRRKILTFAGSYVVECIFNQFQQNASCSAGPFGSFPSKYNKVVITATVLT